MPAAPSTTLTWIIPISRYEADSELPQIDADALRLATSAVPQGADAYLKLPPLDLRISQLAEQITASSPSNYEKALAIEQYLRTHFGYTLQLPRARPQDPLANFLFERKQGHCEYFASSMAVMLRTLGIPSRIVNGFRGGEFNDLTGQYVVRASNAHSWVEAYFPGFGWISFDPTPAASLAYAHRLVTHPALCGRGRLVLARVDHQLRRQPSARTRQKRGQQHAPFPRRRAPLDRATASRIAQVRAAGPQSHRPLSRPVAGQSDRYRDRLDSSW